MPGQSGANLRDPGQPDPRPAASPEGASPSLPMPSAPVPLAVGDAVLLARSPAYLKTADPMPMLRPPDLVETGEVGVVSERRSGDTLAVRFRRGIFLLAAADLRPARSPAG